MSIKLERVTEMFDQAWRKLANKSTLLQSAGLFVAGEIEENFRQRGRPRWAGNRPLVKTGKMKSEAVKVRTEGNLVHIGEVLDSLPYANYIQNGTKKMSARPFMSIPNLAINLVKLFKDYILGGNNGHTI